VTVDRDHNWIFFPKGIFDATTTKNALDITTHIVAVAVEHERANDREIAGEEAKFFFFVVPVPPAVDDTERNGVRARIKK
jgi:hypothetical protein